MTFDEWLQEELRDPEFKREWELHEKCHRDLSRHVKWLIQARLQRDRARAMNKQLEMRLEALERRLEALENKGTYVCPHCENRVKNTGLIGGGCPSCGKHSYDPIASVKEKIDWKAFDSRHDKWPFSGGYLGSRYDKGHTDKKGD